MRLLRGTQNSDCSHHAVFSWPPRTLGRPAAAATFFHLDVLCPQPPNKDWNAHFSLSVNLGLEGATPDRMPYLDALISIQSLCLLSSLGGSPPSTFSHCTGGDFLVSWNRPQAWGVAKELRKSGHFLSLKQVDVTPPGEVTSFSLPQLKNCASLRLACRHVYVVFS